MNFINKIKRLIQQDFLKNVLTLMTGTTIAQLLPILVSPLLTRMYTPGDFGVYALYISIISIISVIVTLRYEFAIMSPKKREDALNVFSLSLITSLIISFCIFIIIVLFNKNIIDLLGNKKLTKWIYFIPLSSFLLGVIQSFNYWFNRENLFKVLSTSRVIQTFANVVPNIVIGLIYKNELGLILGNILGTTASVVYLLYKFLGDKNVLYELRKNVSWLKIKEQALLYNEYPKFNTLSAFLDTISLQLPSIFVSKAYSSTNLGYFNLTTRTISTPLSVISSSVSQVLFQSISEAYKQDKPLRPVVLKTGKYLSLISLFPLVVLLFFGPELFSFVFGAHWRIAGEFARILALSYAIKFVVSPLSVTFFAVNKIKVLFKLQFFRSIGIIVLLSICMKFPIILFVYIYVLFEIFYYTIYMIAILKIS
ncbi:oligosaccharide flippase family protein [Bacillus smithii]|uniref:oligosaccharide flippase family protein n=1 Tax=Bacillus smithii TaxID=1479 RepID=UPI002E2218EE|nr:oligosaccharide flippase family protein [Bacillus smithii]